MKLFLLRFVACLFVVISSSSHAALYDRGNGLIYDDVLNITWLQDANYAHTSGYAAANASGLVNGGASNIQSNGSMGWYAALDWADQFVYADHANWRLPSVGASPELDFISSGELGHMFYTNLGNAAGTSILNNVNFTDPNTGLSSSFLNVQVVGENSAAYWYEELYGPTTNQVYAWGFNTIEGLTSGPNYNLSLYAWVVHDGDIGAAVVPIPTTAWLFGSALAGLLVARRKNKK